MLQICDTLKKKGGYMKLKNLLAIKSFKESFWTVILCGLIPILCILNDYIQKNPKDILASIVFISIFVYALVLLFFIIPSLWSKRIEN
jgi:membrane protein YdbS with pleckstrin-like domain